MTNIKIKFLDTKDINNIIVLNLDTGKEEALKIFSKKAKTIEAVQQAEQGKEYVINVNKGWINYFVNSDKPNYESKKPKERKQNEIDKFIEAYELAESNGLNLLTADVRIGRREYTILRGQRKDLRERLKKNARHEIKDLGATAKKELLEVAEKLTELVTIHKGEIIKRKLRIPKGKKYSEEAYSYYYYYEMFEYSEALDQIFEKLKLDPEKQKAAEQIERLKLKAKRQAEKAKRAAEQEKGRRNFKVWETIKDYLGVGSYGEDDTTKKIYDKLLEAINIDTFDVDNKNLLTEEIKKVQKELFELERAERKNEPEADDESHEPEEAEEFDEPEEIEEYAKPGVRKWYESYEATDEDEEDDEPTAEELEEEYARIMEMQEAEEEEQGEEPEPIEQVQELEQFEKPAQILEPEEQKKPEPEKPKEDFDLNAYLNKVFKLDNIVTAWYVAVYYSRPCYDYEQEIRNEVKKELNFRETYKTLDLSSILIFEAIKKVFLRLSERDKWKSARFYETWKFMGLEKSYKFFEPDEANGVLGEPTTLEKWEEWARKQEGKKPKNEPETAEAPEEPEQAEPIEQVQELEEVAEVPEPEEPKEPIKQLEKVEEPKEPTKPIEIIKEVIKVVEVPKKPEEPKPIKIEIANNKLFEEYKKATEEKIEAQNKKIEELLNLVKDTNNEIKELKKVNQQKKKKTKKVISSWSSAKQAQIFEQINSVAVGAKTKKAIKKAKTAVKAGFTKVKAAIPWTIQIKITRKQKNA